MSRNFRFSTSRIVASITSLIALQTFAQAPPREVAITFYDLPIAGVLPRDDASARALTTDVFEADVLKGEPLSTRDLDART